MQERARISRAKVLGAAIDLFSRQGYPATGTRQIETAAKVKRGMISYHFGSKEKLWKAAVGDLFDRFSQELANSQRLARDLDDIARLRFIVRSLVLFSARYPQVNRLMVHEGATISWRLDWIVDNYVRAFYEMTGRLFDEATRLGVAPEMDLKSFYYILSGGGSLMFSMTHEVRRLTGEAVDCPEAAAKHADALAHLLIREPPLARPPS